MRAFLIEELTKALPNRRARGSVRVVPAAADASGRIDLVLPVPQHPALVGLQIHLQAAFPIPAGLEFSPGVLSPFLMP